MKKPDELMLIAGPCAVESEKQLMTIAEKVASLGIPYLRAGAWKPRSKAGDWEGLKFEGLEILQKAKHQFGLKIVTEIMGADSSGLDFEDFIKIFQEHEVDVYQVGSRNAENIELLKALKKADVEVLYKNPMACTVNGWIGMAGHLNLEKTTLCFRGKSPDKDSSIEAKNTADLVALAHLAQESNLKCIYDPSHSTGVRNLVYPAAIAAISMGMDGLLIETHIDPEISRTDGEQTVSLEQLTVLMEGVKNARENYLATEMFRKAFREAHIGRYVQVCFKKEDLEKISASLPLYTVREYEKGGYPAPGNKHNQVIFTAMAPMDLLEEDTPFAKGEIFEGYGVVIPGKKNTQKIAIKMPNGRTIKASPNDMSLRDMRQVQLAEKRKEDAEYEKQQRNRFGNAASTTIVSRERGDPPENGPFGDFYNRRIQIADWVHDLVLNCFSSLDYSIDNPVDVPLVIYERKYIDKPGKRI